MNPNDPPEHDRELTFIEHLFELRSRLLKACLAILLALLVLLPFSRRLYAWLADPLLKHLPEGATMIAIDVASPFLAPFKLTLVLAVLVAMPVVIYQVWAFVAPGLYKKEKRLARPLLVSATLLFYLGCAFAYYVLFPIIFAFFSQVAPEGVTMSTDISSYLQFVITLFLAFGIAFEVPIATIMLVALGITTPQKLSRWRPYVIIGSFAIGMLLTPPDVISQTLLAIPMWILFELGIILSRLLIKREMPERKTVSGS